jgi:hypothetical protein
MKTPILGGTYVARSVNAADSRMVNIFPEVIPEGGKEPGFLQRAPGLKLLRTVGKGPIRGMWRIDQFGYIVSGTEVFRFDKGNNVQFLGNVTGTGPVSMADNGFQLFIACNGPSFIYNLTNSSFVQITDPDFPGAVSVGYLDGYFVFNEPDSQRIWVTAVLDGASIDPLDFASAEASPDRAVALLVDHKEVWIFGDNSVEVWYNSGAADYPLTPIQGAFNELGCVAPYSVAKLDNGIFWLGADARGQGMVYRATGYQAVRVSTHAVEWHIQRYGNLSNALAYTYQQDGHSFYVLIFPEANTTWVFDVATGLWHERAGWVNGLFTRHRSNCQMSFNNEIVVGDFENGNIYALDLDVYRDNDTVQRWLRTWRALPTGQNNLKRTAQHTLQLDAESGGVDPTELINIEVIDTTTGEDFLLAENNDFLVAEEPDLNDYSLLQEDGDQILQEDDDPLLLEANNIPTVIVGKLVLQTGLLIADPLDPQVMLRWSDDGGHTWSNEHWRSMGKSGEWGYRVFWRRLGMTEKLRDRVYEVSGTDPIKLAIMGAELEVSGSSS